jgi:hypothetical protein
MSLLSDIKNSLPVHYTLSNKTLIIIAHVRDETVYFYNELGPHTSIILLTQPKCYALKKIFLEFMGNMGVTVIDIKNKEAFDDNYRLDNKTIKIIMNLLKDYKYDKILTHPITTNNPQNRELCKLITEYTKITKLNNHYTYNKTPKQFLLCDIQKNILELYCRLTVDECTLDVEQYKNYINIAGHISGIKKL